MGLRGAQPTAGKPSRINVIAVLDPDELKRRVGGRGRQGLLPVLQELAQGKDAPQRLRQRLAGARPDPESVASVAQMAWRPEGVATESAALVGDSAGFVDPFTGEGLYHGLASALWLAERVCLEKPAASLSQYAQWHRERFGAEERFCLALQRGLRWPGLADYVIRQLARKQWLSRIVSETVADRQSAERILSPIFWGRVLW